MEEPSFYIEVQLMADKAKLSRRERERLRHKKDIIEAALKLFAERDFHEVSMQEIATRAEFATGTLYNFFPSKEALFDELAERCGRTIIGGLDAVLDEPGNEIERFRAFFRRQPELLIEHANFIRIYVSEMGSLAARQRKSEAKEKMGGVLDARIERLLESGIRKGLFRPVDPKITRIAITAMLEALAFEMAGQIETAQLRDAFSKAEHLFLDVLLLPEDG